MIEVYTIQFNAKLYAGLKRFFIILLLDFGVFTQLSRINTVWVSRFAHLPVHLLVQKVCSSSSAFVGSFGAKLC